jgi:hypothetical protein
MIGPNVSRLRSAGSIAGIYVRDRATACKSTWQNAPLGRSRLPQLRLILPASFSFTSHGRGESMSKLMRAAFALLYGLSSHAFALTVTGLLGVLLTARTARHCHTRRAG